MREVKFRVWDDKKMWYKDDLTIDSNQTELVFFGGKNKVDWALYDSVFMNRIVSSADKQSQIMLFTGLTDKNGNEIYEGDFHLSEVQGDEGLIKGYLPVVYDNGAFWLDESFKKDGSFLTLLNQYDEPINIQGNIHENPELL